MSDRQDARADNPERGLTWKAIATDLDGTLLDGSSELSSRTIETVERVLGAGADLVAATGRSFRSALPKLAPVSIRWVVCSNGGLIWDRELDEPALHRPMTGSVARAAMERLLRVQPTAGFGWETLDGFRFDDVFVANCPTVDEIGMGSDPGPIRADMEITKLFVCIPGLRRLELQKAVQAGLPDSVNGSASGADFVETTAAGVDKATTLDILMRSLGAAPDQVAVFGDNLNDVAMMKWAGFAVAMGNAHRAVTDHADLIAPSNMDDGVAATLDGWMQN